MGFVPIRARLVECQKHQGEKELTASSAQNVRLVVAFTETGGTLGYNKTVSLRKGLVRRDKMHGAVGTENRRELPPWSQK